MILVITGRRISMQSWTNFVGIGSKQQVFLLDARIKSCTSCWDNKLNLEIGRSILQSLESLEPTLQTCGGWLSRSERILAIFLMKKAPISLASCCLSSWGGKTGLLAMFKRFLLTLRDGWDHYYYWKWDHYSSPAEPCSLERSHSSYFSWTEWGQTDIS